MENRFVEDSQEKRWWLMKGFAMTLLVMAVNAFFSTDDPLTSVMALFFVGCLVFVNFRNLNRVKNAFAPGSGILRLANYYRIMLVIALLVYVSYLAWHWFFNAA
jgi:hypothetical protein